MKVLSLNIQIRQKLFCSGDFSHCTAFLNLLVLLKEDEKQDCQINHCMPIVYRTRYRHCIFHRVCISIKQQYEEKYGIYRQSSTTRSRCSYCHIVFYQCCEWNSRSSTFGTRWNIHTYQFCKLLSALRPFWTVYLSSEKVVKKSPIIMETH